MSVADTLLSLSNTSMTRTTTSTTRTMKKKTPSSCSITTMSQQPPFLCSNQHQQHRPAVISNNRMTSCCQEDNLGVAVLPATPLPSLLPIHHSPSLMSNHHMTTMSSSSSLHHPLLMQHPHHHHHHHPPTAMALPPPSPPLRSIVSPYHHHTAVVDTMIQQHHHHQHNENPQPPSSSQAQPPSSRMLLDATMSQQQLQLQQFPLSSLSSSSLQLLPQERHQQQQQAHHDHLVMHHYDPLQQQQQEMMMMMMHSSSSGASTALLGKRRSDLFGFNSHDATTAALYHNHHNNNNNPRNGGLLQPLQTLTPTRQQELQHQLLQRNRQEPRIPSETCQEQQEQEQQYIVVTLCRCSCSVGWGGRGEKQQQQRWGLSFSLLDNKYLIVGNVEHESVTQYVKSFETVIITTEAKQTAFSSSSSLENYDHDNNDDDDDDDDDQRYEYCATKQPCNNADASIVSMTMTCNRYVNPPFAPAWAGTGAGATSAQPAPVSPPSWLDPQMFWNKDVKDEIRCSIARWTKLWIRTQQKQQQQQHHHHHRHHKYQTPMSSNINTTSIGRTILPGDCILAINNEPISMYNNLRHITSTVREMNEIEIIILRDNIASNVAKEIILNCEGAGDIHQQQQNTITTTITPDTVMPTTTGSSDGGGGSSSRSSGRMIPSPDVGYAAAMAACKIIRQNQKKCEQKQQQQQTLSKSHKSTTIVTPTMSPSSSSTLSSPIKQRQRITSSFLSSSSIAPKQLFPSLSSTSRSITDNHGRSNDRSSSLLDSIPSLDDLLTDPDEGTRSNMFLTHIDRSSHQQFVDTWLRPRKRKWRETYSNKIRNAVAVAASQHVDNSFLENNNFGSNDSDHNNNDDRHGCNDAVPIEFWRSSRGGFDSFQHWLVSSKSLWKRSYSWNRQKKQRLEQCCEEVVRLPPTHYIIEQSTSTASSSSHSQPPLPPPSAPPVISRELFDRWLRVRKNVWQIERRKRQRRMLLLSQQQQEQRRVEAIEELDNCNNNNDSNGDAIMGSMATNSSSCGMAITEIPNDDCKDDDVISTIGRSPRSVMSLHSATSPSSMPSARQMELLAIDELLEEQEERRRAALEIAKQRQPLDLSALFNPEYSSNDSGDGCCAAPDDVIVFMMQFLPQKEHGKLLCIDRTTRKQLIKREDVWKQLCLAKQNGSSNNSCNHEEAEDEEEETNEDEDKDKECVGKGKGKGQKKKRKKKKRKVTTKKKNKKSSVWNIPRRPRKPWHTLYLSKLREECEYAQKQWDDLLSKLSSLLCRSDQVQAVERLITSAERDTGYSVNYSSGVVCERNAVLNLAVIHRRHKVAKWLVEVRNADIETTDRGDFTPLINAAWAGDRYMVRFLLHRGANRRQVGKYHYTKPVAPSDFEGLTAEGWAMKRGHDDVARLIRMGV